MNSENDESHKQKKRRKAHTAPILFVRIKTKTGKKKRHTKNRTVKALVDSGASDSVMTQSCANRLGLELNKSNHEYHTAGG